MRSLCAVACDGSLPSSSISPEPTLATCLRLTVSVIADFSVPAEDFPLGYLLEVRPGVQVRLESVVPTGGSAIPYFWVESRDAEAVETALRETPIVDAVFVVNEVNGETLFRVDWTEEVNGFIDALSDSRAVVLDGQGHGNDWTFRIRFDEHDTLSTFYRSVSENGIAITLEGLRDSVDGTTGEFDLTDQQYEALRIALEAGYFAVPRESTLVELADQLDISDFAVS